MKFELRDYQQAASDAAVRFFKSPSKRNGILVLPTGSGKSLCIADIASKLDGNVLIFQPSREILAQNYAKLLSYDITDCAIFSASFRSKKVNRITFATIGSVKSHMEYFNMFRYIIVDECHLCNPEEGMYKTFFDNADRKILGLTATPYRLTSGFVKIDCFGRYNPDLEAKNKCILKFLTRTRPRIFHEVIYQVDISTLLERGYLAHMRYFDLSVVNQSRLRRNSTGLDFDDKSLLEEYQETGLSAHLVNVVKRLQYPKDGVPRKGILVFTKFLEESEELAKHINGCVIVSGTTPVKERAQILSNFKSGNIKVVANVGVLTTGFDHPELDTIVMARPTMSLALWYQIVGRAIRPHPQKKESWIVDLCGNVQRFGRVEDLHLYENRPGEYIIQGYAKGMWKQLTNKYF